MRFFYVTMRNRETFIRHLPSSGHRGIHKCGKKYTYQKTYNNTKIKKQFRTLKEALCYKYITHLKIRAGLI